MQRTLGQKISYAIALFCYLSALALGIGSVLYEPSMENDPVLASLMASSFFAVSCGIVLHFIANARLKGLLSGITDSKP
jgi:hypothetical protein